MMQVKRHMTLIITLLLSAALISPVLSNPSGFYNVVEFGAIGDGETLNTSAIQTAVDECFENGGGTVHFPPGIYLSGTIYLKDYVKLNLSSGAVLLGSDQVKDYPLNKCDFPSYSDRYVGRALIWGEGLKGIGITGHGTIDGQGATFKDNLPDEAEWNKLVAVYDDNTRYRPQARYINRPYMIRLISCSDVLVEGIHLRNSPMWMQHYLNCDFVTIQNITVYNHGSYNNDMIDIDCCRNVLINSCFSDSDDDGITIKSTGGLPTENVTISNCIVSSFCNAIKMGTESCGGFKNITITNCVVRPSSASDVIYGRREGLAGIALEIVDGGVLDGVTISNIAISGTTAPIFMRLGNRARKYRPNISTPPTGTFRNVFISNIVASDAGVTGCSITGIPGHLIENVTLSNIKISFMGGGPKELVNKEVPEHEEKYPESTMFDDLPAYGFYCRHVDGLTFRDIDLHYNEPDYRPALICDDVHDLKLFNFDAQVLEKNSNGIKIIDSDLATTANGWHAEVIATIDQSYGGWDVEIGDADNDGLNEILITGCPDSQLAIIKKSNKKWEMNILAEDLAQTQPDPGMGLTVKVVDLNNDGENEIILGTGQEKGGTAWFYLLQTDGAKLTKKIPLRPDYNTSSFTHNFAVYDLDGDGIKEVIAAYCGGGEIIRYDINRELDQIESRKIHHLSGSGEESIIADVDNDGDQEYLTSNSFRDKEARVEIYEFDESGELLFPPRIVLEGFDGRGCFYASLIVGDVDNDGANELIVGWKEDQKINKGTVLGYKVDSIARKVYTFAHQDESLDMSYFEKMMEIADADNDGKNELVLSTRGDNISEFISSGHLGHLFMFKVDDQGAVSRELLVDFNEKYAESSWLAVGDVDDDGKNEIILATGKGDRTKPGTSYVVLVEKD